MQYVRSNTEAAREVVRNLRGLAVAFALLISVSGMAVELTPVPPLEVAPGGTYTLPKAPKAFCPVYERNCLKYCSTHNNTVISCELACAVARADCESGFTALGQCNAPKGAGCL